MAWPDVLHRELTPAEHARIRRQLVLIPAYLWLLLGWFLFLRHVPLGLPGTDVQLLRDFAHFYVQGVAANRHDAQSLYDMDALAKMVRQVVPDAHDARFPPVYGPQVALLFSPLARLPYATALYLWMAVSVLVYLGCGYLVWKSCPRLRDSPWTVALLLLAAPALHLDLGFAQASPIGLVCVTAAFLALRNERPCLAGLAIGSLAYKPPLGLAAAVIFVGAAEWRIVLGAIVAASAQLAAGCLYWGPSILRRYAGALLRIPDVASGMEPFKYHMHSWRAFFDLLGLPAAVAWPAYLAASALVLGAAVACWRSRGPLALRYAAFLFATVLVDPHVYVYDVILLTPAFLLLWDWALGLDDCPVHAVFPALSPNALTRRPFRLLFQLIVYFCAFTPGFEIFAMVARVQISVLVMTFLLLLLLRALRLPAQPALATAPLPSPPGLFPTPV